MSSRSTRACCAVLLVALAACGGGSSGGGGGPALQNVGLSAVSLQGRGEMWVLAVSEQDEDAQDLNGDGDADDVVPFVYHLGDGSLVNLGFGTARQSGRGFPSPFLVVGDVLVAFGVSEAEEGATDLNGDGDALDVVLHVYDDNSGLVTNTGLAAGALRPAIGAGAVAFVVSEAAQGGQDLDGSGSAVGLVLHVYDARTQLTTNAQRNVTSELTFHDHAFAHTADELSAGLDLNGDGDQADTAVFEMYDLVLGGLEEVPLAIRGRPLAVNADDWFLLGDEAQEGADLNGDGDQQEGVVHRVAPHQHTQQPLGLSSTGTFGSVADGTDVGFVTEEVDGVDHNGDGDQSDALVVLYESVLGSTFESVLAVDVTAALAFVGDRLAFTADEADSGLDLNGDGDEADDVVELMVRDTGLVIGLGQAGFALHAGGGLLLYARSEAEAGEDWNGDGDALDVVEWYWDPLLSESTSTGLACNGTATASSSGSILLVAVESDEGADLNGDTDLDDLVYVLHDVATKANTSLGVAATVLDSGLLDDGRVLLLVSESAQGEDLNGDGDLADSVLHVRE